MRTLGSKPSGRLGLIAGRIMNLIHSSSYKKIIHRYIADKCKEPSERIILDIGCGGGISVKLFSNLKGIKKAIGIDYSDDMIKLSKQCNKTGIAEGAVEIIKADVSDLPFDDNSFDIITAFDTINFWLDHKKAIEQIFRTLGVEGLFFIVNVYPKAGSAAYNKVKWRKL